MPSGVYERTEKIRQSLAAARTKCKSDCTCGRHKPTVHSEKTIRRITESCSRLTHSDETRAKISEIMRLKNPPRRFSDDDGYVILSGQFDHPLAIRGFVAEHRVVLYEKIGPSAHQCHWSCGRLLEWITNEVGLEICVDHLDDNPDNNDPENLVVSCRGCNFRRGRWKKK